jgi:type IV secretory pathway VirB6-like protein
MLIQRAFTVLIGVGLLAFAASASAEPTVLGNAFERVTDYEQQIVKRVTDVVTGDKVTDVGRILFSAMALALFVIKCTGWALRGFQLDDMVHTAVHIMLVAVMLAGFTTIVPAIFEGTLYVGQAILAGIAGISFDSPEAVSLPRALVAMFSKYGLSLMPDCDAGMFNPFDCIKGSIIKMVAALAMSVVIAVLCVAIMLVDIWGFWIYAIALAVGPVMLPFLLYKRLAFLFEGWLRFFFGVVVYIILARVNLALVAVAILTYQGTTVSAVASGAFTVAPQSPIKDLADVLGLMLFAGVGIFTLLATGRFANAVVAGAAAGGLNFGKAAAAAVKIVAVPVSIVTTGVAGAAQGMRARSGNASGSANRSGRSGNRGGNGSGNSGGNRRGNRGGNRGGNQGGSTPQTSGGLSFGQTLGGAGAGMARAYRDAALRSLKRNKGFRTGYNAVSRLRSSND